MKKTILIILLGFITVGLSAQKGVRKAVRTGNKAYNEQRYGAAETEYDKALKENASSKEASFNLANTYYKQQRWDDAVKEYQHYLTLENEDQTKMSSAWSNMGNTFLKKKANEKGQQMQQMAQQAGQPQQGGQQADNLKLSMEAYKNALRLNPNDDETRYNLAVVQKMIKDKEDENKDQNKDNKQDKNKDQKEDPKQDPKQDPKDDQKDNKQDKQENQMSQDNIQQILQAIEQDEKETQERVKQAKAQERKQKNENNRKQNKDW
ncbi:tetratricopeptide repeat protein [Prevotella sp. 10(H)]|uniref:tetratricopeptide repeat protein n=1 Tax=Prevotella sp. 10(H) TaxID=1158294 RepID=UPI0004A6DD92|nr:tetratricopeptide repeat protein [Prevotella sp. 10(H)]